MWLCRHVEQYFVAMEETKVHLKAWGCPRVAYDDLWYSHRSNLWRTGDKRAMRRKHGLELDQLTILVSAVDLALDRLAI